MPDPLGTYEAARQLIEDDFIVLPYIHADPVLAKKLEDLGCSTVMPLGSPIGSGRGILTYDEINIIIGKSKIPVVVDAGLGVPSEAALAMEMGADAVLVNTAIAQAKNPVQMAEGFRLEVPDIAFVSPQHQFPFPVTVPIQEIPAGKGEGPVELLSVHVEQAGCGPLVGDQQLFAGQIGPDALDAYPLSICHRGQPGEVGLAAAGIQCMQMKPVGRPDTGGKVDDSIQNDRTTARRPG